ncbi:uncharacterized protein SCHCODRAFT_02705430 [Schizophyllum commune H4-8]|uniref:Uncharacterized protein n=1 Tax=Schizophyllum commune (strain H4-8 / FGSC 9210) TaxID=578458 RepID=D8QGQ9_SCHCM|nr:uncharacterized protein SCHCODRAFT_02705430 [Schizophyllum commune H4-8]KAI5886831.1 hypothetical protein SCHCODRAFT_02705430 [Schizophyllum commune H4-8]
MASYRRGHAVAPESIMDENIRKMQQLSIDAPGRCARPRDLSPDPRRRSPNPDTTGLKDAKPKKPFVPHENDWTYERNPKRPSVQLYRNDIMCVVTQDNIYDEATRNHVVAMRDHARFLACRIGQDSFAKEGIVIVHNGLPRAIYKKDESILAFEVVERTKWRQDPWGDEYGSTKLAVGNRFFMLPIDELNDIL